MRKKQIDSVGAISNRQSVGAISKTPSPVVERHALLKVALLSCGEVVGTRLATSNTDEAEKIDDTKHMDVEIDFISHLLSAEGGIKEGEVARYIMHQVKTFPLELKNVSVYDKQILNCKTPEELEDRISIYKLSPNYEDNDYIKFEDNVESFKEYLTRPETPSPVVPISDWRKEGCGEVVGTISNLQAPVSEDIITAIKKVLINNFTSDVADILHKEFLIEYSSRKACLAEPSPSSNLKSQTSNLKPRTSE